MDLSRDRFEICAVLNKGFVHKHEVSSGIGPMLRPFACRPDLLSACLHGAASSVEPRKGHVNYTFVCGNKSGPEIDAKADRVVLHPERAATLNTRKIGLFSEINK